MTAWVVITRPRDEALRLAAQLTAQGYAALVEPMLDIAAIPVVVPPLADYSGLVFTSANGARIFAGLSAARDLPAYAVGDRTASILRAAGFCDIRPATGDAEALASLIRQTYSGGRPLLHLAGKDIARDLGVLLAPGIALERLVIYQAAAATAFSQALVKALYARTVDHVLFFSVRTAETFGTLLRKHGLADMITASSALCLSGQIADATRQLPWRHVAVASSPTADALLALLPPPEASDAD